MRITCVKKMLKAINFANEQKKQSKKTTQQLIEKAYDLLQSVEKSNPKLYNQLGEILDTLYKKNDTPELGDSLMNCLTKVMSWENSNIERGCYDQEYTVTTDFGEHTFFFSERTEGGHTGLCGGIVYHGCPEEGYKENFSVSLAPSYGWQIHT